MKNIIMMIVGVGLTLGAAASQPKVGNGGKPGRIPSKVIVVRPYAYYPYRFGYNPFFTPYYGYGSFYSPFAFQQQQPSKLDLDIEQINNDYRHDIADVRHDETLSKAERRQKIRDLRHERDNSIIETKKEYYQSQEKDAE